MKNPDYLQLLRRAEQSEFGTELEFLSARCAESVRKKLYTLRIKTGEGKGLVMSVQGNTLRLIPKAALKAFCDGVAAPLSQRTLWADEVEKMARDTPRQRMLASRSGEKGE